jgi:hypothetical protein
MRGMTRVDNKETIETFLRKDPLLHIYEIGDLDPFFWPHTTWYGHANPGGELAAIALLYTGMELPTLLALERQEAGAMRQLLGELVASLPRRFYAHLSPDMDQVLQSARELDRKGRFLKMGLQDHALVQGNVRACSRNPNDSHQVVVYTPHKRSPTVLEFDLVSPSTDREPPSFRLSLANNDVSAELAAGAKPDWHVR